MTNPVAKPPRLTDIQQYNATGQLSANGSVTINGTVFHPTNGNPDAKTIGNSTSNPGRLFVYMIDYSSHYIILGFLNSAT